MKDEAFAFSTTAEVLMVLPVGEALTESGKQECPDYAEVFLARARVAEEAGDGEVARAWVLLAHLCRVALRPGEPNEPFRPLWEEPGGRTMVPGDMDEESAAAVRQLGFAVTDGELRARLLDVTWDRLRDAEAAREAVRSYLAGRSREACCRNGRLRSPVSELPSDGTSSGLQARRPGFDARYRCEGGGRSSGELLAHSRRC